MVILKTLFFSFRADRDGFTFFVYPVRGIQTLKNKAVLEQIFYLRKEQA